jgi:hypothetical protein
MPASIRAVRQGRAGEVAAAILFLASDDASYVPGALLFVDGVMTSWPALSRPSAPNGQALHDQRGGRTREVAGGGELIAQPKSFARLM